MLHLEKDWGLDQNSVASFAEKMFVSALINCSDNSDSVLRVILKYSDKKRTMMYTKNMLLGFLGKKSCSGQLGYFRDNMGSK